MPAEAFLGGERIDDPNTVSCGDAPRIGHSEVERLVCSAEAFGALEELQPRNSDAWRTVFPSLAALPPGGKPERKLRICIATEEIVGPVRNGGIGTTYAYLAETLAKMGCDVTILYLRGKDIENGTVEDWVAHYGERGVKFVPAPNFAGHDAFRTGADRWLKSPYNMMRYLLDHPMDVVHVSEWRGSGYFSLLAKRQGLAFANTLFIVKCSSPWVWNRLYGSQLLDKHEDLGRIWAERQSVELADLVIGGSLHLLRWMASQGYRIPRERTFVQPNLVNFDHLRPLMSLRAHSPGTRLPVEEIVFFGRLEARKGLFVFCQAIKRLIRAGVALPNITFMGKPGMSLTSRPDQDILDYVDAESRNWPCKTQVLTSLQQFEALEYLLARPRLAVMPSIIENSSMAVYEAAICGIPFIASSAGGTPELIAPEDRAKVLCEAHPAPLADMLVEALRSGGYVARPSFSNDANIETWTAFHRSLGCGLLEDLLARGAQPVAAGADARFSACVYHARNDDALRMTLESLAAQELKAQEVIVAVDADDRGALDRADAILRKAGLAGRVVEAFDYDVGFAYNAAARAATGDYVLFVWSGVTLRPQALRGFAKVARATGADLLNFFYRVTHANGDDYLRANLLGSLSGAFFQTDLTTMPLVVRAVQFRRIGGFSSDYRVLGAEWEFAARAQLAGLHCVTALMELATVPEIDNDWLRERGYDQAMSYFRVIRPQMSAAPLALRDLLMMARGLQLKLQRMGRARAARAPATTGRAPAQKKNVLGRLFPVLRPLGKDHGRRRATSDGPGPGKLLDRSETIESVPFDGGRQQPDPATASRRMLYRLSGAPEDQSYSGHLFGLRNGKLYGWVRNELDPGEPVAVQVFREGQHIKTVVANLDLHTAAPLPAEMRGHGFAIEVGARLPYLNRFSSGHIRLGVGKNGDAMLGEATLGFRRLADAGLEGCCDTNRHGYLHGWVWRKGYPDEAVDVVVFVDGRLLARLTASSPRDDLAAAGIGRGDHAFRLQIPKPLRDGTTRRITVFTAETGLPLKFGTLMLKGDLVTPI